jgi:Amt family ammonium transporter
VLISAALVLIMIPGVGLFCGGMVRKKNAISRIIFSFAVMGIISLQWILYGYTLVFGKDIGGLIGGLDFLGLTGVGMGVKEGLTIPSLTFMIFQAMFAIITVALITGSYVERIKFSSFLVFSLAWATLVYDPVAHWVWGGGWLQQMGALDFAGGIVVHITAGVSAMAVAMVIGVRKGFGTDPMEPHNIPTTVMGAALLWFGWFGFNAGSALAANGIAANAFVTTNTAAAAAATTWMLLLCHRTHPGQRQGGRLAGRFGLSWHR